MPVKFKLVFYDIETVQSKEIGDRNDKIRYEHEAILICAQQVCDLCYKIPDRSYDGCTQCKKREVFFEGRNSIIDFLNFLMKYQPGKRITCCIAHNARSFDSQIILHNMLKIKMNDIQVCMRGFKILRIKFKRNIHFIDSLMFLPMPLASFQETFDLDPTLTKGFFPYLFLSFENWGYEGEMPKKEFFNMEDAVYKRQMEFEEWYEDNKLKLFNLRDEAISYCFNDVTLLRAGCLNFMESIIEIGNVNPFFESFTLAQLALLIFRKKFMPLNKLGVVPSNNYHPLTAQSKICRKWLTYLNYFQQGGSKSDFFIHPEVVLKDCGLQVDGFCEDGYPFTPKNRKGTVFEFSGCYFHGCQDCLRTNPYNLKYSTDLGGTKFEQKGVFAKQKLHQTLAKLERIKALGYNLVHIWEHEFNEFLKMNKQLDMEISNHPFVSYSNLDARNGLYGGRNEASCLYYKTKPGEKIRFYDYCSLYSYSMLHGKYFIGAPKKIWMYKECEKFTIDDLRKIDGLAYCKVLPNPNLFFPILPYRMEQKLMFLSCKTCVEKSTIQCPHDEEERSITGVWSMDELHTAFDRGYKLMELYELWEYDVEVGTEQCINMSGMTYESLFDQLEKIERKRKNNGFFTAYQKTFIRIKGEASGFPNWCITDEDREKYILDFYRENNVLLRREHIKRNPTFRALAKLMLNALYGKLIQQNRNVGTSILRFPHDLRFYLNSDVHEILDLYCCNDDYVVLTWRIRDSIELIPGFRRNEPRNICITSGIQTTATARLRLYSEIEKLGERCFYMDTDSMIFLQRNDMEYCPTLSNAIGGLSNELECFRKHSEFEPFIDEFVCIGPKSYAFSVINEPEESSTFKKIYVVKCKGFTLTGETAQKINMNLMKSFVLGLNFTDEDDVGFLIDGIKTKRRRLQVIKNFRVVTQDQIKVCKFTFDKRMVNENLITYPYGYRK